MHEQRKCSDMSALTFVFGFLESDHSECYGTRGGMPSASLKIAPLVVVHFENQSVSSGLLLVNVELCGTIGCKSSRFGL